MKNYNNLSIIIPTINEKENLSSLLHVLSDMYPGGHIFISDDGSSDGTSEFISETIRSGFKSSLYLLCRNTNTIITNSLKFNKDKYYKDVLNIRTTKGLTASVLDAINIIPTENFAVIDADFQHPPEIVGNMYNQLNNAGLICAYRTKLKGFPYYRKLLTRIGTYLANSALPPSAKVKDPLSGAFAGNKIKLDNYLSDISNFKLEGFKILFDILKTLPGDFKIDDYGYEFKMRNKGASKINFKHLWAFFMSILDKNTKKFYSGIILLSIVLFTGLYLISTYGDIQVSSFLRTFAINNPLFLKFCKLVTDYGNPLYYVIFAFLFLKGIFKKDQKLIKVFTTYLIIQLVASLVITGGLKILIGRPRPGHGFEHQFFTNRSTFKSFPSGHTTDAFSSAGVFWIFSKSYPFSILTFLLSLIIGLSRIFVHAHYMMDVLTGMVIGFLTALLISKYKLK